VYREPEWGSSAQALSGRTTLKSLPGYGPVHLMKRPVRTRMQGVVGRAGEKTSFTRLAEMPVSFSCSFNSPKSSLFQGLLNVPSGSFYTNTVQSGKYPCVQDIQFLSDTLYSSGSAEGTAFITLSTWRIIQHAGQDSQLSVPLFLHEYHAEPD
jgi:hypothetical protein